MFSFFFSILFSSTLAFLSFFNLSFFNASFLPLHVGSYSHFGVSTGVDEMHHLHHMQRKKYRLQFQPLPEECPDLWLFAGSDKLAGRASSFSSLMEKSERINFFVVVSSLPSPPPSL